MLSQLLLLIHIGLILPRGGDLRAQAFSHAWVILIDSTSCTDAVLRGYTILVAGGIVGAAVVNRWFTFAKILWLLNWIKTLLAWHVHARLYLLRWMLLLDRADALNGIGQERGSVTSLYKVWMSTACVELRLNHQVSLFGVERARCATPPVHDELMLFLHLAGGVLVDALLHAKGTAVGVLTTILHTSSIGCVARIRRASSDREV